jgi:hypothetical protein
MGVYGWSVEGLPGQRERDFVPPCGRAVESAYALFGAHVLPQSFAKFKNGERIN